MSCLWDWEHITDRLKNTILFTFHQEAFNAHALFMNSTFLLGNSSKDQAKILTTWKFSFSCWQRIKHDTTAMIRMRVRMMMLDEAMKRVSLWSSYESDVVSAAGACSSMILLTKIL